MVYCSVKQRTFHLMIAGILLNRKFPLNWARCTLQRFFDIIPTGCRLYVCNSANRISMSCIPWHHL